MVSRVATTGHSKPPPGTLVMTAQTSTIPPSLAEYEPCSRATEAARNTILISKRCHCISYTFLFFTNKLETKFYFAENIVASFIPFQIVHYIRILYTVNNRSIIHI